MFSLKVTAVMCGTKRLTVRQQATTDYQKAKLSGLFNSRSLTTAAILGYTGKPFETLKGEKGKVFSPSFIARC